MIEKVLVSPRTEKELCKRIKRCKCIHKYCFFHLFGNKDSYIKKLINCNLSLLYYTFTKLGTLSIISVWLV